jgi:dTDP-4-dehydrorhamnose reductase
MKKVAILGSTGMLGSTVTSFFNDSKYEVIEFNRKGISINKKNKSYTLDVIKDFQSQSLHFEKNVDFIINCIGQIKQKINPENSESVTLAEKINSEFPRDLEIFSKKNNIKVIQIGTDCVFSGERGNYSELDKFDAKDIYGKTKISGEFNSPSAMTLRCSIIGLERFGSFSLLNWLISQPRNATVSGYTNHLWNGLTTFQFARIVSGIIDHDLYSSGTFHVIPEDYVSKFELLTQIATYFDRNDLKIVPVSNQEPIDRRLATLKEDENLRLWRSAKYNKPPRISFMLKEFVDYLEEIRIGCNEIKF